MTGEWAQQLGLEFSKKNFPGHQAFVCTHTDGQNESGNIHVHSVINSLRKFDVERNTMRNAMERKTLKDGINKFSPKGLPHATIVISYLAFRRNNLQSAN